MANTEPMIDNDEFIKSLNSSREFPTKMRDGSEVKLILTDPSAKQVAMMNWAAKSLSDSSIKHVDANNMVRFACRSCIRDITNENVVSFLKQLPKMPPLAPVVRECLDLLDVSKDTVELIETSMDKKSLTKPER